MLSVIIPVYNVEKFLDKCLESVRKQTYTNLEIIIINDGSTDSSAKICEQFVEKDSRVVYISKENEGTGKTRNLGIKISKGEYITFLDSDDWWDVNYAMLMVKAMEKADIAICDLMYIDEGKEQIKSEIRIPANVPYFVEYDLDCINKSRTFLCGKVFKKSLFIENNIYQPSMAINDFPIVPLLIAKSEKIYRVAKPMYYYLRSREGNTVTSFNALFSFETALNELHKNFEKYHLVEKYKKPLQKMYFSQIRFAMRKGLYAVQHGADYKDYEKLKLGLYKFLDKFWKDHPLLTIEKNHFYAEDEALKQGVLRFLIDDKLLSDHNDKRCITIVWDDEPNEMVNSVRVISLKRDIFLMNEALYWDISDKLLFAL